MIGEYRKMIVAIIGAISVAVTQGLVVGTAAKWAAFGIAVLTAISVYGVPNAEPDVPGGAA